jgi:hypothetical protein
MDILSLVDQLEELLDNSRPIPFTHNVIVDEESVLYIIDQMRIAIPDEIKKAEQIITQKSKILAQAKEEANRTLAIARERSDQMIERDAIVQAAQSRAEQLQVQALADLENERKEADEYVMETLTRLEVELDRYLAQVRNGIKALQIDKRSGP